MFEWLSSMTGLTWVKSSKSAEAHCVEVGVAVGTIHVRDSTDIAGPTLGFSPAAWRAFVSGIRAGNFDLP